jgi:hypothetical protein
MMVTLLSTIDLMPKEEFKTEERSIEEIVDAMYTSIDSRFAFGCLELEFGKVGCTVHANGECPRERLHGKRDPLRGVLKQVIDVISHVGMDLFEFGSRLMG